MNFAEIYQLIDEKDINTIQNGEQKVKELNEKYQRKYAKLMNKTAKKRNKILKWKNRALTLAALQKVSSEAINKKINDLELKAINESAQISTACLNLFSACVNKIKSVRFKIAKTLNNIAAKISATAPQYEAEARAINERAETLAADPTTQASNAEKEEPSARTETPEMVEMPKPDPVIERTAALLNRKRTLENSEKTPEVLAELADLERQIANHLEANPHALNEYYKYTHPKPLNFLNVAKAFLGLVKQKIVLPPDVLEKINSMSEEEMYNAFKYIENTPPTPRTPKTPKAKTPKYAFQTPPFPLTQPAQVVLDAIIAKQNRLHELSELGRLTPEQKQERAQLEKELAANKKATPEYFEYAEMLRTNTVPLVEKTSLFQRAKNGLANLASNIQLTPEQQQAALNMADHVIESEMAISEPELEMPDSQFVEKATKKLSNIKNFAQEKFRDAFGPLSEEQRDALNQLTEEALRQQAQEASIEESIPGATIIKETNTKEKVVNFLHSVANKMEEKFGKLPEEVKNDLLTLEEKEAQEVLEAFNESTNEYEHTPDSKFAEKAAQAIKAAPGAIKETAQSTLGKLPENVKEDLEILEEIEQEENLKAFLESTNEYEHTPDSKFAEKAAQAIKTAPDAIKETIKATPGAIKDTATKTGERIYDAASDTTNKLHDAATAAKNKMQNAKNKIDGLFSRESEEDKFDEALRNAAEALSTFEALNQISKETEDLIHPFTHEGISEALKAELHKQTALNTQQGEKQQQTVKTHSIIQEALRKVEQDKKRQSSQNQDIGRSQ